MADLFAKIGADVTAFNQKMKEVTRKMEEVGKKMQSIGKTMSLAVTVPLAAMGAFAIQQYDEMIQAENKLIAALKSTGQFSQAALKDIKDFASGIQNISTVGDDSVISMVQLGTSMGLSVEQAKRAATNAIALSKAMGMNEESAVRYTAALEQGDATMLTRYLPSLRGIEDETKKTAAAQKLLADMFGTVTAEAQDGLGPIIQLKNSFGDLMEQFGKIIVDAIKPFVGWLKELVDKFQALSPETKKWIVAIAGIAAAIGPLFLGLSGLIAILPMLAAGFAAVTAAAPWLLAAGAIVGLIAVVKAFEHEEDTLFETIQKQIKVQEDLANMEVRRNELIDNLKNATEQETSVIEQQIDSIEGEQGALNDLNLELQEKIDKASDIIDKEREQIDATKKLTTEINSLTTETETSAEAFFKQQEALKALNKEFDEAVKERKFPALPSFKDFLPPPELIAGFNTQLTEARDKAILFGKVFSEKPIDILKREQDALKGFIDANIAAEGKVTEATQEMIDRYKVLGEQIKTTGTTSKMVWDETVTAIQEGWQQISFVVTETLGSIDAIFSQSMTNQSIELDNRFKKEKQNIENSRMSQEAKAKAIQDLEEKTAEEKSKILSKSARQEKDFAVFSAIINTAAAIVKAIATLPPPASVVFAAILGAMGAAQSALIASQPIPAFAAGGIATRPTLGIFGEKGPEALIPLNRMDSGPQERLITKITADEIHLILERRKRDRAFL